jgi:hypothetical protein
VKPAATASLSWLPSLLLLLLLLLQWQAALAALQ